MTTRVSSKGQVVLPARLRRKLGLRAGDELAVGIRGGAVMLVPRRARRPRLRIITDPLTGVPVISAGGGAPALTSAQVGAILAEFP